ncbi:hypothetical protein BSPWISOXPB_1857 [uncultured Gammaproteobacteria bacterium]|nr:hypothetical protein BSPWISOXPB_1857 [uncultured Gammaproteobacteria bacterium]
MENGAAKANERPERTSDGVLARYTQEAIQDLHPHLAPEKIQALTSAIVDVQILATLLNTDYIGRYEWRDRREYERMRREGSFEGSSLVLVGAAHVITDIKFMKGQNPKHSLLLSIWVKIQVSL